MTSEQSAEKHDGEATWRVRLGEWRTLAEQRDAAYRLLGELVGEEVAVAHDASGAPFLPDCPHLYVSVSHCAKAVAAAVCGGKRVGIDVESRRRISDGLMARVCSPAEQTAIHASPDPTMAFLQLWTRKEAVLKMRGMGIRGFTSMVEALSGDDCQIVDLESGNRDVVAALAVGLEREPAPPTDV